MTLNCHVVLCTAGLVALGCLVLPALADESDKQTTFRLDQPVEVPGRVLSPGTYVFKLADLAADRNVVQILSEDEPGVDHLLTSVMAIPAYRPDPPEKPMMTFEERPSGTPEAVQRWFYPGDNYGWEFVYSKFVYPKVEGLVVASSTTSAPAAAPAAAIPSPKPAVTAPLAKQQPPASAAAPTKQQNHTLIARNRPPATAHANSQGSASRSQAGQELSKTTSGVPFAELLGILMLASGACVLGRGLLERAHR